MTRIYINQVKFPDGSYFWRGECNGCDWIDEHPCNPAVHNLAIVHLRVFHNGGIIVHPTYEIEVKGK